MTCMSYILFDAVHGPIKTDGESLVKIYCVNPSADLRARIASKFAGLILYIMKKLKYPRSYVVTEDDLKQSGAIGLLQALDRFDIKLNVKFKTFAYRRIKGAMMDTIRMAQVLKRTDHTKLMAVRFAKEQLAQKLYHEPGVEEICEQANISLKEYNRIKTTELVGYFTLQREDPRMGTGACEPTVHLLDLLEDVTMASPEENYMRQNLIETIVNKLNDLPARKQLMMRMYYYEDFTLMQIAERLGISESRVSQVLKKTRGTMARQLTKD